MPLPPGIPDKDYQRAKQILSRNVSIQPEFDWDQDIDFPIEDSAQPGVTPAKWRGITVELAGFIIGRATPSNDDDDEPVFLGQGRTPHGPRLIRFPSNAGDAPSVKAMNRKTIARVVAFHNALDGEGAVRVQAQGTAYEEDTDAIWNDLLDAIKSDAKTAAQFGLASAPGLSVFGLNTPSAGVKALSDLLPTFRDEQVGGDIRVFNTGPVQWFRSKNSADSWRCRKYTLHTNNITQDAFDALGAKDKPGWYLAEWIITLGTEARSYGVLALADTPSLSPTDPSDNALLAAAFLASNGESLSAAAEGAGFSASEVAIVANALEHVDVATYSKIGVRALAGELIRLKKRT